MITLKAISYYLPEMSLTNNDLNGLFPDWSVDKIARKTGILQRRIADKDEFVSTMAVKAANNLFNEYGIAPADIQFILLCTQSPDYFLPTTACIVQHELGIPVTAGALDFNLGCSGYVYGLSLAKGLIASGEVENVLLITSETYSKHIHEADKSVRTIFGDAASASFISKADTGNNILKFTYGTDGAGANNLIVKGGGMRYQHLEDSDIAEAPNGLSPNKLFMNGSEIFAFTLKSVPAMVNQVLAKNNLVQDDIDLFVFHQANKYMLEHLRLKLGISEDKFFIDIADCGNTVSSTIPIALKSALTQQKIKPGMKVMIAGFGVGYSWGANIIQY
ncbi:MULTISPECIES: ketoacyl-ACP synthase III [unclassified Chitinophaga]|uniref:ketoacyl-ACP synthase III n=1 Tax=unclassified Chitinophaga TaxID=2619133 RepID=UPI00300FBF8A